jgi:hypothetical protein
VHRAEEAIGKAGILYDSLQLFERLERVNRMETALLELLP